jgi:hypothetical protein
VKVNDYTLILSLHTHPIVFTYQISYNFFILFIESLIFGDQYQSLQPLILKYGENIQVWYLTMMVLYISKCVLLSKEPRKSKNMLAVSGQNSKAMPTKR